MDSLRARWHGATAWTAAGLAWALAYPAYHLGLALHHQAGWLRGLGTAAAGVGLIAATAAVLAGVAVAAGLDRREAAVAGLRAGFVGLVWAVLALLGLALFWREVGFAPAWARWAAALGAVAFFVLHLRQPAELRAFTRRALRGAALVGLAVPVAALPLVAWGAVQDRPRVPGAIAPLAGTPLPGAPKRIVLVTIDSLGWNACRLDGGPGDTPNLTRLAREADLYARCVAAADRTMCVMPTLLTGLRPSDVFPYQANIWGYVRPGFATGVAGHLRGAGYGTSYATSLVSPPMLGLGSEYGAGTSSAPAFPPNELNPVAYLPLPQAAAWFGTRYLGGRPRGPAVLGNALERNERNFDAAAAYAGAGERTFTWVHGLAPHLPYWDIPPDRLDGPHDLQAYRHVGEAAMQAADAATMREHRRIYQAYVRYADHVYGRLEAAMRATGIWDESLVIVLGDHGEAFTPGRAAHAEGHLEEAVVNVPLFIKPPHRKPGDGRLVQAAAATEDVLPTVLAAVYGRVPAGLPGVDLLRGAPPADRILVAWAPPRDKISDAFNEIAAYQGDVRLLRTAAGREVLHDARRDPAGAHDMRAARPDLAAALRGRLDEITRR